MFDLDIFKIKVVIEYSQCCFFSLYKVVGDGYCHSVDYSVFSDRMARKGREQHYCFPNINAFTVKEENMFFPMDRSEAFDIIGITMLAGCSSETKKRLITLLFEQIQKEVGIQSDDI